MQNRSSKYEENNLPTSIPVGRAEDLTGQKKNRLTILYRIGTYKANRTPIWLAKCDCGNYTDVRSDFFKKGIIKGCGCGMAESGKINGKKNMKDLTNQRFGKLIALYPTEKRQGRSIIWHCKCDCGNEKDVSSTCLLQKQTQSCGCLTWNNLTNQRFGKLIALYPIDEFRVSGDSIVWHCKCDCGNEKDVKSDSLLKGATSSCGCLKESLGEYYIKDILDKNKISYQREYIFKDLKDKGALRFDFAILNKDNQVIRLIEFDGEQHFKEVDFFSQSLEENQRHDTIKNQYCKDNNIPLVRIPYWERNNITLEMLLGKEYEI